MPKFLFFNANGLTGKAEDILDFAENEQCDIGIIVETWLRDTDSSIIRRPIFNVTKPSNEILLRGGRRGKGGILGFPTSDNHEVRIVETDIEQKWIVFETHEV